jgi:hypothetical protein
MRVIAGNAPSLRAMRVIAGYDPQTTADAKKTSDNLHPPLRTTTHHCGHCASLRATTRKQQQQQEKTSDNNAHHYGQSPVVAGYARHCGLRPANNSRRKKNVGQQRPPLRTKPRRCGQCASLRATTRNPATDAKKTSDNNAHHYGQRPVVAGYDPQTSNRRKKKRQTTTPTITDKAPSLRDTTRNPPINNSRRKKNVGQKKTKKQK